MRLRDTVFASYDRPFEYGVSDCCQFVGGCLEGMGKRNPMRLLDYDNETDADRIIARFGGLAAAITAHVGDPLADPLLATEGDVVICECRGTPLAGIVLRTDLGLRCVLRTPKGVVDWPLERATMAWRI